MKLTTAYLSPTLKDLAPLISNSIICLKGADFKEESMFEDMLGMMGAITAGPPPKLGRDTVKGLIVSTVNSTDMGHETALLDDNGAHPVERYDSEAKAIKGHKKWVKFAQNYKRGQKVTKLGYGSSVDDSEITLKPNIKQINSAF